MNGPLHSWSLRDLAPLLCITFRRRGRRGLNGRETLLDRRTFYWERARRRCSSLLWGGPSPCGSAGPSSQSGIKPTSAPILLSDSAKPEDTGMMGQPLAVGNTWRHLSGEWNSGKAAFRNHLVGPGGKRQA